MAGSTGLGRTVWVAELDHDGDGDEPTTWRVEGVPRYGPEVLGWLDGDSLLLGARDNDTTSLRQRLYDLDVITGAAEEISIAPVGWTGAAITRVSFAADLLDGATVAEVSVLDRGLVPKVLGLVSWSWSVLAVLVVGLVRRLRARRRSVRG